jgi:hypothetical protein
MDSRRYVERGNVTMLRSGRTLAEDFDFVGYGKISAVDLEAKKRHTIDSIGPYFNWFVIRLSTDRLIK